MSEEVYYLLHVSFSVFLCGTDCVLHWERVLDDGRRAIMR